MLKRVDVSFFSSSKMSGQPIINIRQDNKRDFLNFTKNNSKHYRASLPLTDPRFSAANDEEQDELLKGLVINQETDIVLIIGGI